MSLRNQVIRLAADHPGPLRTALLSLIAGSVKWEHVYEPPSRARRGIRYPGADTWTWDSPEGIHFVVHPKWMDGDWDDAIVPGWSLTVGNSDYSKSKNGLYRTFSTSERALAEGSAYYDKLKANGFDIPPTEEGTSIQVYVQKASYLSTLDRDADLFPEHLVIRVVHRQYPRQRSPPGETIGTNVGDPLKVIDLVEKYLRSKKLNPSRISLDSKSSKHLGGIKSWVSLVKHVKGLLGQAPAPTPGGDGGAQVKILEELRSKGQGDAVQVAEQALELLKRGKPLDSGMLKSIRHKLYQNKMRNEADLFR